MNRREVEAFAEATVVDQRVRDAHALLVKALRAFTFQDYGKARGYTSLAYRQLDELSSRTLIEGDLLMINYTPHAVTVRPASGEPDIVYPPSGVVPRVAMRSAPAAPLADGCPTITVEYGEALLPDDHPRAASGALAPCIVSTMFADAYRRQHGPGGIELFVPDSGPSAIRENGQIVAVRALIRR